MKIYVFLFATFLGAYSMNLYADEKSKVQECPASESYLKLNDIDYEKGTSGRLESGKGVETIIELPVGADKAVVTEAPRATRISEDLKTLKDIARAITGETMKLRSGEEKPKHYCYHFKQGYERSTLEITPKNASDDSAKFGKATFIVGPTENLYITADMGVTNLKQLTWDSKTGQAVEKSKPSSFYIGFNYKLGDVFDDGSYSGKNFYKNVSLKFLVKASATPSESFGTGMGYEFPWANVFAARVVTRNDPSVGGTSAGSTYSTIFGLSFKLSTGLSWLKSNQ